MMQYLPVRYARITQGGGEPQDMLEGFYMDGWCEYQRAGTGKSLSLQLLRLIL